MKKLAIIGANEFQADLIIKAKLLGYETHVFSWGGGEVGEQLADYFYEISITEKEEILAKCQEIGVDGVCSIASDLANVTVHWVARKLGLIAHNEECIENTTNKFAMRNVLAANNQPIPFFTLVESYSEVKAEEMTFPVIVKPIDRSGSRGIRKVHSELELKNAIQHSQSVSFTNKVLIEEFVDGREFSIESISENGKHKVLQITEKFTTGSPKYIETAHLAPARLTMEQKLRIEKIISNALSTLDIRFGPSHSEVKLKSNGEVIIIEIGSRMGGDFIGSFLVKSNTNIDFLTLTIKQSLGESIKLDMIFPMSSSVVSSMVYYQVTDKNVDISQFPGVNLISIDINSDAQMSVSCSNERYSCSKLLINNTEIQNITSLIETDNDSI